MNIRDIVDFIRTLRNAIFSSESNDVQEAEPLQRSLVNIIPNNDGDGEDSFVQKGNDAVAFGKSSSAFGTSSTNAKDRGITEESTPEEIVQEWASSDPEDQKFALTLGEGSHIEGNNCLALGTNSHAEGNGTAALNNSSHSEGTGCIASGKYAHAEGLETVAQGERSHAEGQETQATAKSAHAEGKGTEASGERAHAEGLDTVASGKQSHAEGNSTKSLGEGSHAEGQNSNSIGKYSHAEGHLTKSSGSYSHVEGELDAYHNIISSFDDRIKSASTESRLYQTLDYGTASAQYQKGDILWKISSDGETWTNVLDQNITVTDVYGGTSKWFQLSKKLGIGNSKTRYVKFISEETIEYPEIVNGYASHAEGCSTKTTNDYEHAEGKYNESHSGSTIHSVGIGTSYEDRKNAFEIMQNGDTYVYGLGGYDGTNPASATPLNQIITGANKIIVLTQQEYDDLTPDANTLYFIK